MRRSRTLVFNLAIFYFLFGVSFLAPQIASAKSESLFFSTPPPQVQEGDRLTIDIKVKSPDQPINAVSGIISFPSDLVRVVSFSKDKSIINLWIGEPRESGNRIVFEGVILNPGFRGSNGIIFSVTLEAKRSGTVPLNFTEGAVLANDGLGTNVLATLPGTSFKILSAPSYFEDKTLASEKPLILPVITKYTFIVDPKEIMYIKGKGEPLALTKITFQDESVKSVGEKLIGLLQINKKRPTEAIVKNDKNGIFHYLSAPDLMAGVYNATPFLVDLEANVELPGTSVQLLVNDSEIVRFLVVLLNVLTLLIPIVLLCVIIFFIPWYSWRKMRVIKKEMLFEEDKIGLREEELRQLNKMGEQ